MAFSSTVVAKLFPASAGTEIFQQDKSSTSAGVICLAQTGVDNKAIMAAERIVFHGEAFYF